MLWQNCVAGDIGHQLQNCCNAVNFESNIWFDANESHLCFNQHP